MIKWEEEEEEEYDDDDDDDDKVDKIVFGKPKGKRLLGDLSVGGRIIKWGIE
jgi:hypothetical protein